MRPNPPIVVFVDVEGVLRDRPRPSFAAAASTLKLLARDEVPLVLCSSRTRAEIEHLQQELGITHHPFISENGGAAFVPAGYFASGVPSAREVAGYWAVEFGRPYAAVVDTLHRTAERLRIEVRGFSDMSVEEVARECHLPLLQARLAKLREYEELFYILDPSPSARSRLFKALHAQHLRCISGHRYDHVGAPVDNGVGVELLGTLYRRAFGPMLTVGLAAPLAEGRLLQLVDYPVIVQHDEANATPRLLKKASTTHLIAADNEAGWAEAIVDIVARLRGRFTQSSFVTAARDDQ